MEATGIEGVSDAKELRGLEWAIIFELNNNRPAYVSATVRKTAAEHEKHPAWTEDDFVAALQSVMEQEYVDNNTKGLNGATDEEARQKARNIVTKAGHR